MSTSYFGSANILSRPSNTPSLDPSRTIEALIPRFFNQVLKAQYIRCPTGKMLITRKFGGLNKGEQHLNISIAAKSAFPSHFENMLDF